MGSVHCVCFLLATLLFYTNVDLAETDVTKAEKPGDPENKTNIGLSADHIKKAVKFIKESELYDKIQEVLVHYIQHFAMYRKMTMRTKSGKITVPISDKIERNLSIMIKHVIHVEHTSTAIKNDKFDFTNSVNVFRFIRNNTVLLDKVFEHTNASFKAHGDIENPEKLQFYHALKSDARFFKIEQLNQSIKELIQIQKDASPSLSNIATGRLFGSKLSDLNSDECLHIGDYASADNVSISVQFYEAAVRRLDAHNMLMINKSQILERIINFYSQFSPECEHRISKLQDQLEEAKAKEQENAAADDDDDEEDEDEEDEPVKDRKEQIKAEKDGKAEHQKNKENNKDESADPTKENSDEEKEIREKSNQNSDNHDTEKTGDEDMNETDIAVDTNDTVDKNDELCFRKIMKMSSALSSNHDEL